MITWSLPYPCATNCARQETAPATSANRVARAIRVVRRGLVKSDSDRTARCCSEGPPCERAATPICNRLACALAGLRCPLIDARILCVAGAVPTGRDTLARHGHTARAPRHPDPVL